MSNLRSFKFFKLLEKRSGRRGEIKTVLAEANIMYKGSDAREYGTHSKAG